MGVGLRKMMRSRVIVVFGATSRIGRATIEELTSQQDASIAVVAAVEDVKDPRARRLKKATSCFLVKCRFGDIASIQRVVRNADSVLLVPALSESGTRFSKRVIDAVKAEQVPRLVITSSILTATDFWRHRREDAPVEENNDLGYEAVEAHARSALENCVSLRIPLLMETIMYCREEIMFASRFIGCFAPETLIPCIAVSDVAIAASQVLLDPKRKFNATYCLANAEVACSALQIEQLLTQALNKQVQYRQTSNEEVLVLLREKGTTVHVAESMVRMKNYLEAGATDRETVRQGAGDDDEHEEKPVDVRDGEPREPQLTGAEERRLQTARFGYTNDFHVLTNKVQKTPVLWLQTNAKHFERSPQNQMQLFVIGSGEGLFIEIERFLARQMTSATTAPLANTGEAAIPTSSGNSQQSKVTFCAIKSTAQSPQLSVSARPSQGVQAGGAGGGHYYQMAGGAASPMDQLLKQMSSLDVVVYIPPLRLGAAASMEVTKSVVEAAASANVWGIVVVSTIFTGQAFDDATNCMGEMEQFIERSGVPYVIVRLPLFMEYFLALSSTDHPITSSASSRRSSEEEEEEPTQQPMEEPHLLHEEGEQKPLGLQPRGLAAAASAGQSQSSASATVYAPNAAFGDVEQWNLLDRSLATSPQYLIAMPDAAKALAAIAFTFPLHRNRVRTLYTERLTMQEIEGVLQSFAYKGRTIDFAHVDALHEQTSREFWRVAYWTKSHTKHFLERSVALSARDEPIAASKSFEDVTECAPISLERWARAHAKAYTHALEVGS
ncbi:Nad binding rossmann-fold containing protein [Globisporangium polare]